jgi:hypothetical protein
LTVATLLKQTMSESNRESFHALTTNEKKKPTREDMVKEKLVKMGVEEHETLLTKAFTYSSASTILEQLEMEIDRTSDVGVKLLFVDIGQSYQLVNTLLKITGKYPKHGRIHTALAIGSQIVDWNNRSLCIPRGCYSGGAILAFDLTVIPQDQVDEKLKALCAVIESWNVNIQYDKFKCNCQHFVDVCLDAMEIEFKPTGVIQQYTKSVHEKGYCERNLTLPQDIQDELGVDFLKENKIVNGKLEFSDHEEYDKLVHAIMKKFGDDFLQENMTAENHRELRLLLKAFDRGFWLNNYRNEEIAKQAVEGCPFNDPSQTGTKWSKTNRKAKESISNNVSSSNSKSAPKKSTCTLQ